MSEQTTIALREMLALACRILGEEGQGAITLGHVSLRIPGEDKVLMKPFGLGFEEVRPSDLVVLDLEGNKLDGPHPPHGERFIHTEIFKALPELQSVIHTHPFYATVLGTTGEELLPLTQEGALFIQGVPLYDGTPELITTKEMAIPIARALGDKRALFIKNHGVVVVGRSLQEAVISALYLEIAAKAQVTAKAFGRLNPIEKQTALRMHDRQYQVKQFDQFWNYYARKFQKPS
jgi:L-fuculose-phosphate aldolase